MQVLLRDSVSLLECAQLVLCRLKHLIIGQDASTIGLGELLNYTNDSGSHLTSGRVYLLHESCLSWGQIFTLSSKGDHFRSTLVHPLISRDIFVVSDPLRFRKHLYSDNIRI